jgi:hypothetical protein
MVAILDTLDAHPDGLRFGPLRSRVGGSKKGLYAALGDLAETGEITRMASVYLSVRDYEGETDEDLF